MSLECRVIALLRDATDVRAGGSHMFFSYSLDLTSSCQQQAKKAAQYEHARSAKDIWNLADAPFTWNKHLAQALLGACK